MTESKAQRILQEQQDRALVLAYYDLVMGKDHKEVRPKVPLARRAWTRLGGALSKIGGRLLQAWRYLKSHEAELADMIFIATVIFALTSLIGR